jgi:osmoprotectant transport system permease protein
LRFWLAAAALGALLLPWLTVAPNRLLPGRPVSALDTLGWNLLPVVSLLAAAMLPRLGRAAAAGAVLAAFLLMLAATASGAARALAPLSDIARAGLGGGFWIAALAMLGLGAGRGRGWFVAGAALGVALLAASGALEPLSLMVEYRARAEAVHAALLRHLSLAAGALALALAVAVPLAYAGFRAPRLAGPAGAVFAGVQVIPGIALFALLIPLLAALLAALPALRGLGIGAIGPAPAVIATAAYLTLPLFRSLLGGLHAADADAVAAARAMGMTEARITREVRLPLALPVLAGGLRVALVQAIGLVTLGGLVGAGGLGAVVFEGLAQFATDLMLLGSLPIIALALLADTLARAAEKRLAPA